MKRTLTSLSIVFLALTISCTPSVTKVATGMQKASNLIAVAQDITKEVYNSKLISKDTEVGILQVCIKANELGKQVNATLKAVSTIDPATKNLLLVQITEISNSLDPDKLDFIIGIKNPEAQTKVKAAFVAVRSALTTVTVSLAP